MLQSHLFDNRNQNSFATKLRRRRFKIFLDMLKDFQGPISILDIGGIQQYWDSMEPALFESQNILITLLNIEPVQVSSPHFISLIGDGRSLPDLSDKQFDIVFSNSTIEHVGTFNDQCRMAAEVMRLGKKYYVQTPNRYFPLEPHSLFPFFQFLPEKLRVWMVEHMNLGWYSQIPDRKRAALEVVNTRLMTRTELAQLFPEAVIYEERVYGLVKSFAAYTI